MITVTPNFKNSPVFPFTVYSDNRPVANLSLKEIIAISNFYKRRTLTVNVDQRLRANPHFNKLSEKSLEKIKTDIVDYCLNVDSDFEFICMNDLIEQGIDGYSNYMNELYKKAKSVDSSVICQADYTFEQYLSDSAVNFDDNNNDNRKGVSEMNETINYFDKDLLTTKPYSYVFHNLFTQNMTNIDINEYRRLYSQLTDDEKAQVLKLAKDNNKMDLYEKIKDNK